MKLRILISILLGCPSLILADLTSGPQVSDPAGPFTVIKCSGAADGVAPGTELCYRSRYGNAPQVIVFTRDASSIAGLAGELDKLAGTHSGFHRRFGTSSGCIPSTITIGRCPSPPPSRISPSTSTRCRAATGGIVDLPS